MPILIIHQTYPARSAEIVKVSVATLLQLLQFRFHRSERKFLKGMYDLVLNYIIQVKKMKFDYSVEVDKKWEKIWEKNGTFRFDENNLSKKLYLLEMFSYPSASKLHLGHWWNYSLPDSWGRMKRMQGYNVFHPMGFDAFGLPAENYAIKTGIHPKDSTYSNIETMIGQLKQIGATYDWKYLTITSDPTYYKWTQWLFLKLYNNGLAYRKNAPANWCPACKTVLANEQVNDGICERCGETVIQKSLMQWFFKITKYADELIEGLGQIDWPEKTKMIQKNWIGKSNGAEISFPILESKNEIQVFTTRPDTLMGVTYVVLAPENPLVDQIIKSEYKNVIQAYRETTLQKTEIERLSTAKEKTGVFTGAFVKHPLKDENIPVWVSDYVLLSYGTGAVMAVPAHDERDYKFAKKFNLPIRQVIETKGLELPYIEHGTLCNSGKYDGMNFETACNEIVKDLDFVHRGKATTNYRLRDWLISRQRYWGTPIPIIYCDNCGEVPVLEDQLPVELPYHVEFNPSEESPLGSCESFFNVKCPKCGSQAKRETDTLDTFVCSSWYYLRYYDTKNIDKPWNMENVKQIMPVDLYIGGVEHAAMHLLYARFIYKALRDMGYVSGDEPFKKLIHQGIILGSDGQKMSKSKNNTVLPDDYIDKYGSDIFRTYLAFGFSYAEGGPWSENGIISIASFFKKVIRMLNSYSQLDGDVCSDHVFVKPVEVVRHKTIKAVTDDIERFSFNTAIARLMEFRNTISEYQNSKNRNVNYERELITDFVLLLSPFAPHFTEEIWYELGHRESIFNETWPLYDEKKIVTDVFEFVIQVNGRIRTKIRIDRNIAENEIKELALNHEVISSIIQGKEIKNIIFIPNKLLNIVV